MTEPRWDGYIGAIIKDCTPPDPVFQTTKGWYYYAENWADTFGPFENETAAREGFEVPCKHGFMSETMCPHRCHHCWDCTCDASYLKQKHTHAPDCPCLIRQKNKTHTDGPRATGHRTSLRYVYVAGPMSKGLLTNHVRHALEAANIVRKAGGVPYLPQLSILWDIHTEHDYESWMEQDFAWVERCDALIRLPGESAGADREIEHAKKHGKPVFFGVEEWLKALIGPAPKMPLEDMRINHCEKCGNFHSGIECLSVEGR